MKFAKSFTMMVALLAGMSVFTGCKKDEEKPVTKTELLAGTVNKSWGLTTVELIKDGMTIDVTSNQSCRLDNISTFFVSKKYQEQEGANKCPNSADYETTWSFNSAETELTIGTTVYKILEVSGTKAKLEISNPTNSDKYRMTFTAK